MKSIDTYLCKQPKKEFSFNFMGVDYFVGDKLSPDVRASLELGVNHQIEMPIFKAIKIRRFARSGVVDCEL